MKKLFALIGSLGFVAVATVSAYASIPSPNGVVNGCYTTQTSNGVHAVGIIDSIGTCPSGTVPINWNQTGPQGPVGATGATGP